MFIFHLEYRNGLQLLLKMYIVYKCYWLCKWFTNTIIHIYGLWFTNDWIKYIWYTVYIYIQLLNYTILAPPSLVCKSMSLDGMRELRATPSWRESPPESLSRYVSLLGVHHRTYMPLGRVYGVIGLWDRLLVYHMSMVTRLVHG